LGFGGSDGPAEGRANHVPPKPSRQEKPAKIEDSRLCGPLRLAEGRAQQGHTNLIESSPNKDASRCDRSAVGVIVVEIGLNDPARSSKPADPEAL
jgi:hypothetical protein